MGFLVSHAKKPSGSEAGRGPFIRTSVCPCIRASLRKSAITFNLFARAAQNFQGLINSSQVVFGQVIWTPSPKGSALTPKSGFSAKYISSQGFGSGGRVIHFCKREDKAKINVGSGIMICSPRARQNPQKGVCSQVR